MDYLNNLRYNHIIQNHGNIKYGISACLKIFKIIKNEEKRHTEWFHFVILRIHSKLAGAVLEDWNHESFFNFCLTVVSRL